LCKDLDSAQMMAKSQSTMTELLAWFGFLGASGLVVSPVDLIPDVFPVIGWSDDLGYALLALVCGYIGWMQRRRRLTGQPAGSSSYPSSRRPCTSGMAGAP
jgi:uncharacterized membrane protein YkvA (DUF1232 family)